MPIEPDDLVKQAYNRGDIKILNFVLNYLGEDYYIYFTMLKACEDNNLEVVKYLVEKKKAKLDYNQNGDSTALEMAYHKKNYKIAQYLIDNGANVFVDKAIPFSTGLKINIESYKLYDVLTLSDSEYICIFLEYLLKEYANVYTEEDINNTFQNICKNFGDYIKYSRDCGKATGDFLKIMGKLLEIGATPLHNINVEEYDSEVVDFNNEYVSHLNDFKNKINNYISKNDINSLQIIVNNYDVKSNKNNNEIKVIAGCMGLAVEGKSKIDLIGEIQAMLLILNKTRTPFVITSEVFNKKS
jgi:ankyrin repeat protein